MKKFLIQAIALLLLIIGGIFFYKGGAINLPLFPQPTKTYQLAINENILKVEVSDTQDKRSKGLGGREKLASDEGMLFVFDKADKYPFWMKGLTFPLDFVWISNSQVVDILQNVPPPPVNVPDQSLTIYQPKVAADKVLEVNAGVVQRLNIKVGDTIKLTAK